jgi:hypothetical protein
MSFRMLVLMLLAGIASAQPASDVTEDGLVRVPSSRKAGVYRLPDATFGQYRRVMLAPAPVTFRKNRDRMKAGAAASDRERISAELTRLFHEELVAELVQRGGFKIAESPAPDVLQIAPSILDVDMSAPMPALAGHEQLRAHRRLDDAHRRAARRGERRNRRPHHRL